MTTYPVDLAVASTWARVLDRVRRGGRDLPPVDGLIAATALTHDLVLVTHNTRDFAHTGCDLVDPFG